jgi:AAA+ superfamily predicted ATPase
MRRAVESAPTDVALRLHLAELELDDGQRESAIATLSGVLQLEPGNQRAGELMLQAISGQLPSVVSNPPPPQSVGPVAASSVPDTESSGTKRPSERPSDKSDASATDPVGGIVSAEGEFDWDAAEDDLDFRLGPAFVGVNAEAEEDNRIYTSDRPTITLADVGGMESVKERLNVAFLAPLQNPELRAVYGKSLRGGLLMYGPPGCGKTYIARAVAGELGASFMPMGVADVLDKWLGSSERNIHEFFMQARRDAPCVVFLDELDTLGQRRSSSSGFMTSVVNQLLTELDGVETDNEGVFVLGATNQPWQVDSALRRPGRFDRTVLVLPPDQAAREAIFKHHLETRPIENIDLRQLAAATDGYTGADIAHICESAAEAALMDSVRTGKVRMIVMKDLITASKQVRPSIGQWLETVKNVVMFGEDDGTFDELRAYLKKAKRW